MRRHARRARGFTLLEVLVVVAILGIVAIFAIPAFLITIQRAKMDSTLDGVLATLAQARAEAVRRGVPVVVEVDLAGQRLRAFADVNAETGAAADVMIFNPDPAEEYRNTDYEVTHFDLPAQTGATSIRFWGAADDDISGADAVTGFSDNADFNGGSATVSEVLVFERDGSLRDPGEIRLAMGKNPRAVAADSDYERNYYEIATKLWAVGRFEVRKWIPENSAYEIRMKGADGTPNWKWY